MHRRKSYFLCSILTLYNALYICLVLLEICDRSGIQVGALDAPGLLSGFVIFPLINLFLWSNSAKIEWADYSLAVMLPVLWLLIVPGGSFANFIFINPPLIGVVSSMYLLRFKFSSKHLWVKTLVLWVIIIGILLFISALIPIFPE